MRKHKTKKLAAAAALLGVIVTGALWTRSEMKVRAYTQQSEEHGDRSVLPPEQRAAAILRGRKFERIWSERNQRNVTAELIPFLDDPLDSLRLQAVQALSELEDPQAEAPLQALLDKIQQAKSQSQRAPVAGVPEVNLRLALGRIRSRDLKGEKRITSMAQSVGLSLEELARVSQQTNSNGGSQMPESSGDQIVESIVDTLHSMAKRGEDVSSIANRLALNPAQARKVKAASLPSDQEVTAILDYLSHGARRSCVRRPSEFYPDRCHGVCAAWPAAT